MNPDAFNAAVAALTRVQGVRGAMVVEAETGVPVTAELAAGVDGGPLAALAASLFQRAGRATAAGSMGALTAVQLEAAGGHVVMAGAGPLVVVAIAESDAQLGMIRVEAERAAAGLQ
jgi:predicted regulator of Ras-like GTPase activity (Roadblock/LC7/MglB family)